MRSVVWLLCLTYVLAGAASQAQAQTLPSGDEFLGPFPSWLNLRTKFGAAGDGSTDDTSALQSALDAIGSYPKPPVLYIPAGTYRITRTLNLSSRLNVAVIGELPDTTILKWAGPAGGVMLNLDGIISSRVSRLTFDGGGTAGVGLDQSWNGQDTYFDTHNEYADDIMKDMKIGMRGGHLGYGSADSVVLRSRFLRTTTAGVSIENFNALNWFIRECFFQSNYVGVTNTQPNTALNFGAGNFHVYDSVFVQSSRADIEVTSTEYFSFRGNLSIGSGYFFLANPSGSAPCPTTFQGNTILNPVNEAMSIGNAGPVMVLDNVVKTDASHVGTVLEGYSSNPINANLISAGNTLTTNNPYNVFGRFIGIDDVVASASSIANVTAAYVTPPLSLGRPVYEVPAGATSDVVQSVINTASSVSRGLHPIVHFPFGSYATTQTIQVPAGSDVQLVGDGANSGLRWSGPGSGPVLHIAAPTQARILDLHLHGNNQVAALTVDVDDKPNGLIFMDQVFLSLSSQYNLLVEGLDHTRVKLYAFYNDSAGTSIKVTGGDLLASGQPAEADVNIFGGGDGNNKLTYDISSGGRIVAEDMWYEGAPPGFVNLTGSGSFTLMGARVYNEDPGHGGLGREIPPFIVNNYTGNVNILNTKIARGGIAISGQGSATNVLALGVDGPAGTPNYFLDSSPLAKAGLFYSSLTTPVGGSVAVPDQNHNIPSPNDFIKTMLVPGRNAQPVSLSKISGNGTDLRLFRVTIEQCTTGIDLKAIPNSTASNASPLISIISPSTGETVSGVVRVSVVAPSSWGLQFKVDGNVVDSSDTLHNFAWDTTQASNGVHTLTASGLDPEGLNPTSAPVRVIVNNTSNGTPPIVSIASPSTNAFLSGTGVPLVANVVPGSGLSIVSVQFLIDGVQFGSPLGTAPYMVTLDTTKIGNGTHIIVVVATDSAGNTVTSPAVTVSVNNLTTASNGGGTPLVSAFNLNVIRNNHTGWVGLQFTVGSEGLTIASLGRLFVAGNTGTHVVKLVQGSDGSDVPGGAATISFPSGTPGQFTYAQLPSPVFLPPHGTYYLASQETSGGDQWYDYNAITAANVVHVEGAVYSVNGVWSLVPGESNSYVPVNLVFSTGSGGGTVSGALAVAIMSPAPNAPVSGSSTTVAANASAASGNTVSQVQFQLDGTNLGVPATAQPFAATWDSTQFPDGSHLLTAIVTDSAGNTAASAPIHIVIGNSTPLLSGAPLITAFQPNRLLKNQTGWNGMQIRVNVPVMTVTALGRIYLDGNSDSHIVKLVNADGTDIPGGSVTISLPSGAPGQFVYAALASPVTLLQGNWYFLVSQDMGGQDTFYDYTPVTTTNAAALVDPIYWDGSKYVPVGVDGYAFIPLNLLYR